MAKRYTNWDDPLKTLPEPGVGMVPESLSESATSFPTERFGSEVTSAASLSVIPRRQEPRGRPKQINKSDFRPFSTNMSDSVKAAIEQELFNQRRQGTRQTLSELLDQLLRDWLKSRGVTI